MACLTQLRVFTRAASLKLHDPAVHYGAVTAANTRGDSINEDALPLVRRGIVAVVCSVPALAVFVAAQILGCEAARALYQGRRRRARIASAKAAACLLSLQTCALCAAVRIICRAHTCWSTLFSQLVLKGRSLSELPADKQLIGLYDDESLEARCATQLSCFRRRMPGRLTATFHMLLWFWLVLVVAVLDDPTLTSGHTGEANVLAKRRVVYAFVPLWAALALLVVNLLLVIYRHRSCIYRLQRSQLVGATLYIVSSCFVALALVLWLGTTPSAEPVRLNRLALVGPCAAASLGLAGALCGCAALHLALWHHARQLVASRGHGTPLPLAQTAQGYWGISGAGESFWFILGSFERIAPSISETPSLLSMAAFGRRCLSICSEQHARISPDAWHAKRCVDACSQCGGYVEVRRGQEEDDDADECRPATSTAQNDAERTAFGETKQSCDSVQLPPTATAERLPLNKKPY